MKEASTPDFLLGRMLLKCGTLLTTRTGIVGVVNFKYTRAGTQYYDSKRISLEHQDLAHSLQPLIEEAIVV